MTGEGYLKNRQVNNFVFLSIAEGLSNLIFFGVVIYLARVVGSEGLGIITFARSIVIYLLLFVNAGLELYAIRQGAREPQHISQLIGTYLSLRLFLLVFGLGLLIVIAGVLPKGPETRRILLLYGGMLVTTGLLLEWPFQAVERMAFVALGRLVAEGFFLAVILLGVRERNDLHWVPVGRFLGTLAEFFLLFLFCVRLFGRFRLAWDPSVWKRILKTSFPLSAGFMMVQVYSNMDHVMIGLIRTEAEVGFYAAASKIVMAVVLIGVVYHKAIFPSLSRLYHEDKDKMDHFLLQSIQVMVYGGFPLVLFLFFGADRLFHLLYGKTFYPGIPVFRILLLKVLLMWVNGLSANGILAADRGKSYLASVSVGALINLVLNAVFIPVWGMQGAAVATVLSEVGVLLFFIQVYFRHVRIPTKKTVIQRIGLVFGFTCGCGLLLGLLSLPRALLFLMLCFFYAFFLFIFKIIDFRRFVKFGKTY